MSTRKMFEKILNRYNLFCLNEKEVTYYRSHYGCKSTIDLTLANLTIAPEEVTPSPLSYMKGKTPPNNLRDGS